MQNQKEQTEKDNPIKKPGQQIKNESEFDENDDEDDYDDDDDEEDDEDDFDYA
jgi:hypothetical protein